MLNGERLDRPTYTFLHTLDEGNTAVCWLTEHEIFGCKVVQKTVSMLGMKDAAAASEPELLKRIEHPRIVQVWEAQWDPSPDWKPVDGITFTTPYHEGGSVYTALIEGHVFGIGDALRITGCVLEALDHIHAAHGLLHRDVKPANIMLDKSRSEAFLGDLGSAAHIQPATGGAGAHAGSPLYLAPEARESGIVTPRSDLYSLGMTLAEMLHGRFPYETLDPDEIDRRLDGGRRSLPDSYLTPAVWIPKSLSRYLRSLCNRDPAKRPESAAEALRALNDLRVVDWKPTALNGLAGTWVGSWPPEQRRGERRLYEVSIEPIDRGANKGRLKATARWRKPNRPWRNYARLTKVLNSDPAAVAGYFRSVEAEAQASPTR